MTTRWTYRGDCTIVKPGPSHPVIADTGFAYTNTKNNEPYIRFNKQWWPVVMTENGDILNPVSPVITPVVVVSKGVEIVFP